MDEFFALLDDEFALFELVNWLNDHPDLLVPQARRQNFECAKCENPLGLEPIPEVTALTFTDIKFILLCEDCACNGGPVQ